MAANWGKKEDHKATLATADSEGVTTAVWRWLPTEDEGDHEETPATADKEGAVTGVWRKKEVREATPRDS